MVYLTLAILPSAGEWMTEEKGGDGCCMRKTGSERIYELFERKFTMWFQVFYGTPLLKPTNHMM